MKRHFLAAAAALAVLALPAAHAAEPILPHKPPATGETPTFESWKRMAESQANALAAQLPEGSGPWVLQARKDEDSKFTRLYTSMLQSQLLKHGVVLADKNNPSAGTIDIQVDSKFFNRPPEYRPGTISLVTAGLWVVYGVTQAFSPAGAATVIALGADGVKSYFESSPDAVAAELAVTLSATKEGLVKASTTNVFLIAGYGTQSYDAYKVSPKLKLVP